MTNPVPATTENIRSFAFGLAGIFVLFATVPLIYRGWDAMKGTPKILYGAALAVFLVGLIVPGVLKPVFVGWMKLAGGIGWFNTNLILVLSFYLMITPVAVLRRLLGRDRMHRALDKSAATYWRKKPKKFEKDDFLNQY